MKREEKNRQTKRRIMDSALAEFSARGYGGSSIRARFFYSYPVYQRIFCEAAVLPPAHLRGEIQRCRQDFDRLNIQILERLLTLFPLRPGISKEEVIDIFRQFQDFINVHDQMPHTDSRTFDAYEETCRRALNVLLYGVIERKRTEHD